MTSGLIGVLHEPMSTGPHLGLLGKGLTFKCCWHSGIVQHTKKMQSRPYLNGFVIHIWYHFSSTRAHTHETGTQAWLAAGVGVG